MRPWQQDVDGATAVPGIGGTGFSPSRWQARTVRLVTFDLDGVLVDSFQVMRRAFEFAYRETVGDGRPPFDEFCRHLGRHFGEIMRRMQLPAAMEELFTRESYRLAGEVKVCDGIGHVLEKLSEWGIALGIATGKEGERARALLSDLNLLHYFGLVVGGDEVRRAKPAPDPLIANLRHFRVAPRQSLFVGDSALDLRAGRRADVWVAAALWGVGTEAALRREGPDFLLRDPEQLVHLVSEDPR